ncbi:MAG: hypothetical protein WBV77_11295 [Solirubrobacteraceae bacterium]
MQVLSTDEDVVHLRSGMKAALMVDAVWSFGNGALQLTSDQTARSSEVVEFPGSVQRSRGAGS